jgi:hypothetical protein
MALFHRDAPPPQPATPGANPTPGWAPVTGAPFDGRLDGAIAEINRVVHGASRNIIDSAALRVGATVFRDVYRTSVAGRSVTIANAWTEIEAQVRFADEHWNSCSVVAIELPTILGEIGVRPRHLPPDNRYLAPTPTGDPGFDSAFVVTGGPGALPLLTPPVRARIAVRSDWYVHVSATCWAA